MNESLRKELFREIHSSRNRFLSILIMVALGVMFLVGLRSAAPDMRTTADSFFDSSRFYDIQILSTLGLTQEDVEAFSQVEGVEAAEGGWSIDAMLSLGEVQKVVKAVSMDRKFNTPTVVEGRLPEGAGECAIDAKLQTALEVGIGDTVTLSPGEDMAGALTTGTLTITGVVESPLYISLDRGTSSLGDGSVLAFVLLPRERFTLDYYTLCSIRGAGLAELDAYGSPYGDQVAALTERLETAARDRAEARYETLRSDAQTQIDDAQTKLDDARTEADKKIADGEKELSDARKSLDESQAALDTASAYGLYSDEELAEAQAQIDAGEADYADGLRSLEQARTEADQKIADAQEEIDDAREQLEDLKPADVYVLSRGSNYGFVSYDQNATRMENLARMFPVIFFVVAALVCLTTMTRMVEEQRTQIGTVKAMGYGTGTIAWKFLIYGMLAALVGTVLGAVVGTTLIPWVIFTSYGIMYTVPDLQLSVHWGLCLGAGAAGLACTVGATLWAMGATARSTPAQLMRPKTPKAGKRIFLERITPLWRRMSFSVKVSARNLLRYKKRFWMTVVGVAGCTALMISGLGLRSSIFSIIDLQYGEIYRYNVQAALDPDVAGAEADLRSFLQGHDNVASMAEVYSRAVSFQGGDVHADGHLTVTDDPEALSRQITFRDMKHGDLLTPPDDGVLIDEKLAERLDVGPGDEITMDCGGPVQVRVAGVVEHYVNHVAYMSREYYDAVVGEAFAPNTFMVTAGDTSDEAISGLCQDLLGLEGVSSATNLGASARSFRETMEVVDAAVTIIILSAAALALVVLYNLTNINITERLRELATIKVLGFYDGEVAMYIYRENIVLTILGIALGQVLGKFLCTYLIRTIEMDFVMFGREALPRDYLLSVVLSLVFAVIVNILMYFRMKKIDMIQSLKSVE